MAPRQSDLEILDTVYHTRIRPTLEALEPDGVRIGESLFRDHWRDGRIARGTADVSGSDWMSAQHWEFNKQRHVLSPGFHLSDDIRVILSAGFVLWRYIGKGGTEFTTRIVVEWDLGATHYARNARIDSTEIPTLEGEMAYQELEATPVDADYVAAEVMKSLLDRITELSKT